MNHEIGWRNVELKKTLPLLLLLLFSGCVTLTAQSKFLFSPSMTAHNLIEGEVGGVLFAAGIEYRPKTFFGLEARVKYGFYGFKDEVYPDFERVDGVIYPYHPNGHIHYRMDGPQIGIAPRVYQNLEIIYDGLSIYAEPELVFGRVRGELDITGDYPYEKTFSEPMSYYSASIGLELWQDRSHQKKRDYIMSASVGVSTWDFVEQFERHIPDTYSGSYPKLDLTLTLCLTLKIPIGTKLGAE